MTKPCGWSWLKGRRVYNEVKSSSPKLVVQINLYSISNLYRHWVLLRPADPYSAQSRDIFKYYLQNGQRQRQPRWGGPNSRQ